MQKLDLGPSFSENLVNSLSGGLEALTQNKLQQIQNQQRRAGIQALGYSPQEAQQLSGLPDSLIQAELTNRTKMHMASQKKAQEQAYMQALAQEYGLGVISQGTSSAPSSQPLENQKNLSNISSHQQLPPGLNPQQAAQLLRGREVRERANQEIALKEREISSKESKESRIFSDPYISKRAASDANISDLNQLVELSDQGIRSGGKAWLARTFGLDEFGRNLPTELAQKIIARLKTNVGAAFPKGTRITNFLDATFQKTLPDLINSPQGIRLIAQLLINAEEPNVLRDEARQDLMQKWKGQVPFDAPDQINKLVKDKLKQLEKDSLNLIIGARNHKKGNPVFQAGDESSSMPSEPYDNSNESVVGTIGRNVAGIGSRLGAFGLTLPYSPIETGLGIGNYLTQNPNASSQNQQETQQEALSKLNEARESGRKGPTTQELGELIEKAKQTSDVGSIPSWEQLQEKGAPLPPSYSQVTNFFDKVTGNYTAPKNFIEKAIHGFANTVAGLKSGSFKNVYSNILGKVLNTSNAAKISNLILPYSERSWRSALSIGAAGELAGQGLKAAGAGPLVQAAGKLATMIFADTGLGSDIVEKAKVGRYDQAKEGLGTSKLYTPQNQINMVRERHRLRALKEKVELGNDPDKKIILDFINQNEKTLENMSGAAYNAKNNKGVGNTVPVQELVDLKIANNKWYNLAYRERVPGEKHLPAGARPILGEVNGIIKEPLDRFGKINPKFGKPFAIAEDLHEAIRDTSLINEFINENMSSSFGLKTSFGKALSLGLTYSGIGALDKARHVILNHPAYRKEYFSALQAAAQNNLAAFIEHANRLDEYGKEYDKK